MLKSHVRKMNAGDSVDSSQILGLDAFMHPLYFLKYIILLSMKEFGVNSLCQLNTRIHRFVFYSKKISTLLVLDTIK